MSFIDHFRHPINSDEIRFITEEQQRLEQAEGEIDGRLWQPANW